MHRIFKITAITGNKPANTRSETGTVPVYGCLLLSNDPGFCACRDDVPALELARLARSFTSKI